MAFVVKTLTDTWFCELSLPSTIIEARRIPSLERQRQWKCAVDERKRIIFTQLLSDSHEMRDGLYYYFFAAGRDVNVLTWENGEPRVVRSVVSGSYPRLSPKQYAEVEVKQLAVDAKRLLWAADVASTLAVRILDSSGNPIES